MGFQMCAIGISHKTWILQKTSTVILLMMDDSSVCAHGIRITRTKTSLYDSVAMTITNSSCDLSQKIIMICKEAQIMD